MKDYPYFKAYVAEILFDTMGMTQAQKGDYLDSLLLAWKTMNPEKMPQWMQEYADDTIKKSAKLSENSKSRWTNAMQLHNKSNAKAMQTPYIEERRGEDRIGDIGEPPIVPQGTAKAFDRFWEVYPKKVGKAHALTAWKKAKGKPSIDKIIQAVSIQAESTQWQKNGGQYIPNPATWLNQGRWDDKPTEVVDPQSWAGIERKLLQGATSGQDHIAIGRDC